MKALESIKGPSLGPQEEVKVRGVSHHLVLLSLSPTPPRCPPGMAGCLAGQKHSCRPGLGSGAPATICGAA